MRKIKTSKSLLEVWEWKDKAFNEVKDLDVEAAIKKRLITSLNTTKTLGFHLFRPSKGSGSRRSTSNIAKRIGV
jgi:hypothetical protein